MHMITEWMPRFHPPSTYRILYVGRDLALLQHLQHKLADCDVIYCPCVSVVRALIQGINYSLLLFDEVLMDTTAQQLTDYTRSLPERERTPIIIYKQKDNFQLLTRTIARLLVAPR